MINLIKSAVLRRIYTHQYNDILYRKKINSIVGMTSSDKRKRGVKQTVRLMSNFPGLWQRTINQTSNGSCIVGETLFVCSGPGDLYLILNSVFDQRTGLMPLELAKIPKEKIWGLHMEPSEYIQKLGYNNPIEHDKISRFYTSDQSLYEINGKYIACPPYVHWHIGKSFDFISQAKILDKKYDIGVIVSDLTELDGHKRRLEFLEKIDSSNLNVAIWGRGDGLKRFRNYKGFILNKWEAHSISKFSIVMENSISPYYWSEKVSDCILAGSIPLYYGCPKLDRYFCPDAFINIDISGRNTLNLISSIINSYSEIIYSNALTDAKNDILTKHNLYSFIDEELKNFHSLF